MKKLLPLLFLLAVVSCKDKTYAYTAKVYQENSIMGDVMIDSIQAESDFSGYANGYSYFLTCKKVDKDTKIGNVTGFDVYDQNGVNLKNKLTNHQIDSAVNMFKDSPINK